MGSFDFTCAVSGFPISAGEKVRFFLLSENPYNDSGFCYMHDDWFPRSFPLIGSYNGYGNVEDIKDGPEKDLWLDFFKIDLKTRGWGDNSCHDVPTSKDMSFDNLLEALQESRVLIRQDIGDVDNSKYAKHLVPKGVPTIKRISKRLIKANQPMFAGWGRQGYLVDNVCHGTIRVRWHGEGEEFGKDVKHLSKITHLFSNFVTVIKAGDDPFSAEMFIHPKPGTDKFYTAKRSTKTKSLHVRFAMIREDVWQLLCQQKCEGWYGEKELDLDCFKNSVKLFWDKSIKCLKTNENNFLTFIRFIEKDNNVCYLAENVIPFTIGLSTSWCLMVGKFVNNELTEEQINNWLNTVAEFILIHNVLMPVRYYWRPSYSCGPQFGEWDKHENLLNGFIKIAKVKSAEYKKLYMDEDK